MATSFEYRAHPVGFVHGGLVAHPLERGADVFGFYRELTSAVPDELTVFAALVHAPDGSGQKLASMPLCHCGDDPAQAEADLKPLRDFGPPAIDLVCRTLQVAPSTYYDAKTRPPSARAELDVELRPKLRELWERSYSVDGRRKLTRAAARPAWTSDATRSPG